MILSAQILSIFNQLNKSIPSTMNDLYPFVEQVLKNYSEEAVLRLISEVSSNPGENTTTFECPVNYEYILKRFIGACLSREPTVKFNAYFVLTLVVKNITTINIENLYKFIHSQTNYKKHCQGKFIQIQAYIIGKILIVKALSSLFLGHLQTISHLVDISSEFPEFEEQIIQLIFQLVKDKKSRSLFRKLSPTTKSGFLLFSILESKLTKGQLLITNEVIDDALSQLVAFYPKKSILLSYLGPLLSIYIQSPAQFLQVRMDKALGSEEQELNVKKLYFILQLIESHLSDIEITNQNLQKTINVKLLSGWLFQLKVKNKHIRKLAEGIIIHFQASQSLAFAVLKEIHDKELNLDNINSKHPLFSLYENVEPHAYAKYLLDICDKQKTSAELQQKDESENKVVYFNELQFFVVLRHKELTIEQIASTITLFISRYQANKEESHLTALTTILNAILKQKTKKSQAFKPRLSLILSKLDFNAFELGQTALEIKKAIKDIRTKVKDAKQQKNEFVIRFLNFLVSFGFYTLIYPEEIQIFAELLIIEKDLQTNILFKQDGQQPTKKRKVSKEQDRKKPVHVLVDIFISLLTKSPHFLRISINNLFEQLIAYLDGQDLSHLLQVVTKPDHEYIEDTQID